MIFLSIIREESDAAEALLRRGPGGAEALPGTKRRSLVAQVLLFDVLKALPEGEEAHWRLRREPGGRPVLLEGGAVSDCRVSISHSGGWVACAVTRAGPIGVDLEVPRPGRHWREIAQAVFGAKEVERVLRDGENGFYRIWTLREAIAKATGTGLRTVTDRCDRVGEGPDAGTWTCRLDHELWQLTHLRPARSFNLAVAVKLEDAARKHQVVELNWWHLSPELRNILPCESMR